MITSTQRKCHGDTRSGEMVDLDVHQIDKTSFVFFFKVHKKLLKESEDAYNFRITKKPTALVLTL